MRLFASLLGLSLLLAALALSSSCNVDGYCIDCFDARGTGGDAFDANNPDDIDADLRDGAPPDACVVAGNEVCNDQDDDCDGEVDEGELNGVGISCGSDIGECVSGTTVCEEGEVVCGDGAVNPTFELCNLADDDCDNNVDENNPEGGIICGTNAGECQAGVQTCNAGTIECIGEVTGGAEACNGLDDDCDGSFDEGITLSGDCGPDDDLGLCEFGTLTCVGGAIQCVGAVLEQVEQCDAFDRDCDGNPTNGFNLSSDPFNCTGCGLVCDEPNAFMTCNNGCEIAACETDFHDLDPGIPGCEFGPCSFTGAEICNGLDDDCDGNVDEGVNNNPPDICDPDGQCAGTVATCNSVAGQFECNYTGNVTAIVDGQFTPEGDCDELDNDCDGRTDEAFALKGAACDDGESGVCQDTGTMVCNATDDGIVCNAVDVINPGNAPTETCNNLDDDCDGTVDDGDLQEWVDIGGGVEVMKYEASRPDSTTTEQGFVTDASVCGEANRIPWTNITQPQAEAACARIGATLCSETNWERACETDNVGAGVQQGSNNLIVFEAEDATLFTSVAGTQKSWAPTTLRSGFSGTGGMIVEETDPREPNTTDPSDLTGSPRVDYTINFTQTGTHFLWVRMLSDSQFDDSMYFAFNDTDYSLAGNPLIDSDEHDAWLWFGLFNDEVTRISFDVPSVGNHTLSFYNREDGLILDRFIVTTDINFVPLNKGPSDQCEWSYETDCRVYQPNTCNGEDFDGDSGTAGDQDVVLATGSMAACFADWEAGGDAFDLSGNVKEWTQERAAGVNPIRGGSFNNTEVGISCEFDFLTADDAFFLPNIGFRCCR